MSKTRNEVVADHLITVGRITSAAAHTAHGYFYLPMVIRRLRTSHRHLVPEGREIITVTREDALGRPFAEYRLVARKQAFPNPPAFLTKSVRKAA
ncbi:hypothetical protein DMC25_06500 [Caulobacter sp. D4A]|uniref:hypothetical protein n=1 Tax=unclassified Caulobacter TaxID=2648921 RepID=UPI000D72C30F|nr:MULTISPECIES: hypothetical protein [unclassified Caulobacter]PXA91199.1 hypothetical protein DMC25_06500 [Caulobacter sp. D4A]PXA96780.1 hypothetical protein DMC18_00520 [Caulobacter sp. D5]